MLHFAAKKGTPDATADEAGHRIIAWVQEAADVAKEGCERAMDLDAVA